RIRLRGGVERSVGHAGDRDDGPAAEIPERRAISAAHRRRLCVQGRIDPCHRSSGPVAHGANMELYHTVNSVCAQKVRIQLEEKGLPWTSRLMTLRGDQFAPEYLKLNPNGVVPTLVHDGEPVIESSVILYYLEECFPQPSLMPRAPRGRMVVRLYN